MTISMIQPLIAGNALRLFITPPADARYWRILKKGADAFAGAEDTVGALVAYEGNDDVIVDADTPSLQNNVPVFYRPFYRMPDDTWLDGGLTSVATPTPLYADGSIDVMGFVRERLEAGFLVELQRGNFVSEDIGIIQVYTAPPSLEQNIRFPLITISVESDNPDQRAIGEDIDGDSFDEVDQEFFESEGWLSATRISITCWSQNSDERVEMRKALKRLIIANLPVFDYKGIQQIELSMNDVDAISGEFDCPIYQVNATMACLAASRVGRPYTPEETIKDVEVTGVAND